MATVNEENLVSVGGTTGHAPGVYFYSSDDSVSDVKGNDYWDQAADRLDDNSLIITVSGISSATPALDFIHVDNPNGDDVTPTTKSP